MEITDTDRLNWIINHLADLEAPDGEDTTWVVYTPKNSLGAGEGCSRDLRTAIDIAIKKNMPTKEKLYKQIIDLAKHLR